MSATRKLGFGEHLDEKSAFRPYGRDAVVFFISTRRAFYVQVDYFRVVREEFQFSNCQRQISQKVILVKSASRSRQLPDCRDLGVMTHYRLNPRRRHFRLFVSRPRSPNSSGRSQLFSCGLSAKAEQNSK